ncbi:Methyltransferase domain-containing protein [Streptoalloteichus hindustanus]|uniref:Methyltransferase domain-containing protein n=1 Tax=Streptoalloteichus hindustanus TaxID=2017 RepID=A0A1M5EVJ6_STRHI|nr:Methyltransferase domain-containing protein [Streptoalloteichus hindustanus]
MATEALSGSRSTHLRVDEEFELGLQRVLESETVWLACFAGIVDWVREFYSTTGSWWARADARLGERDWRRVGLLREHAGGEPKRVLELGSGYGTTAVATAKAGHEVTAVEISDRADHLGDFADDVRPGSLTVHKADFFEVDLPGSFDVVCYWNGFGVGTDADQRRLLTRIAAEWLRPGGLALVDVFNPLVWARWDGDEEHKLPDVAAGYDHELWQRTAFDPVTCTAIDTWWEAANPERKISQALRCYTPADLSLLLAGTGLALTGITVGDRAFPPAPHPGLRALLQEHHEYLAVLRPLPRRPLADNDVRLRGEVGRDGGR